MYVHTMRVCICTHDSFKIQIAFYAFTNETKMVNYLREKIVLFLEKFKLSEQSRNIFLTFIGLFALMLVLQGSHSMTRVLIK